MGSVGLTKTLVFQLNIETGDKQQLRQASLNARSVYNETVRLVEQGLDWDAIPERVSDKSPLVKNTTQRIVHKALEAVRNCYEHDQFGFPSHTKSSGYPLRANYREGYNLSLQEDDEIGFRISTEPYEHITGTLCGSDSHLDLLGSALRDDTWKIGTAEALIRSGNPELHVTLSNSETRVQEKTNSETIIGVDVNEANVALSAISSNGIQDTLVIDFPVIKFKRHQFFTIRKRVQEAGKLSALRNLKNQEKRFVRELLHDVSCDIVTFVERFESPCIAFEDLKGIRDGLDYGRQMNRRIHRIPFRALQFYTCYKAAFKGIPNMKVDPKYTSQTCAITDCEHIEASNRHKKRFKCRSCGHQDHADRNASLNIAKRGMKDLNKNVPALNSLPQVQKVRRQASGAVDAPTVTRDTAHGNHTDGVSGVFR
jgi:putative transposase